MENTKKGFKYDIIKKSEVVPRDMPKCFLADTAEEAEKLYNSFSSLLNSIAYSYSVGTGIDKDDLFRESLIGLAKAYQDWDSGRSEDFRKYATYRIKEVLNEYVRHNITCVKIPSYIKKAQNTLRKITELCESLGISWEDFVFSDVFTVDINDDRKSVLLDNKTKLENAAERAGVDYQVFVRRIQIIPKVVSYSEEESSDHKDDTFISVVVNEIIDKASEDEKEICNYIMAGLSNRQIAVKIGKSEAWVRRILLRIRKRLI